MSLHDHPDLHACGACTRIPPQSGTAFQLRKGQVLHIIDPMGEQVADLFAFNAHDQRCALSSGRSLDYASKIYLSAGDKLYANDSQVMFTILEDTVGKHDFLLTPCSQEMFEILYQHVGHHPSCFGNLRDALAPFGIKGEQIGSTFNVFMNVNIHEGGRMSVDAPTSKAGDRIALRAEMDLICGLTACSAEGSNNGTFKPIDFRITDEA
ncbi:MAG: urea carboxylase-associated family protein [Aquabacterium sp.]